MNEVIKPELDADLQNLTKEELILKIQQLELRLKSTQSNLKKRRKEKPFDFKRYKKRHVALKVLYLGWDYRGFASQEGTEDTIEAQLFKALIKTKLLESRESSNYQRCGRTDKGVSAFSQVISLDLRTNLLEGKGVITPDDYRPEEGKATSDKEIPYPRILNHVLPKEIRIIAWAPVEPNFSARFDCLQRTYKYWFPKGSLDVKKMHAAGQYLVGEHDFRNFCKMNIANGVVNHQRKISRVDFSPLLSSAEGPYDLFELTITGQAFLWHQIRCIVGVLFLVGQSKEKPQVVSELLDVKRYPRKPHYNMASELPLVLFDCDFENVQWIYDNENQRTLIMQLQNFWTHLSAKTTIIRRMLQEIEKTYISKEPLINQEETLLLGVKSHVYKPLLERPSCDSLEEKIEHFSKKRKVNEKLENSLKRVCDGRTVQYM